MRDVIPGQVWEDKQGNRMKLVTMPDGTVGARSVFHPNHPTRAGQFKEHYPAIGINPVVFAQHHDLVEEPGGIEVKPPTPPPAPEFRVGDVVRLKCGGPPMVVSDTAALYNAREFDEKGEPKRPRGGWMFADSEPMDVDKVQCLWHKDNGEMTWTWIRATLLARTYVDLVLADKPNEWTETSSLEQSFRDVMQAVKGQ